MYTCLLCGKQKATRVDMMALVVDMWVRSCHYAVCEACAASAERTDRVRRTLIQREGAHIVVNTHGAGQDCEH